MERGNKASSAVVINFVMVLLALILTHSVHIIDAGEVGVKLRLGKVDREELYPGIHFVFPWIESVVIFSTRVEKIDMTHKTRNPITALSVEGLPVRLDVTVLYRIIPQKADEIYKNYGMGFAEKVIIPIVR